MKKLILSSVIVLLGFAIAMFCEAQSDLTTNSSYPYSKKYQDQSAWVGEKGRVRWDIVTYSVDRFGGTGNSSDLIDLGIDIPTNAIVVDGLIDVITAQLPSTNLLALQMNTADDLLAATSSLNSTGIKALVPVGTAATAVKATDNRNVYLEVPGTITQGVFKVWIQSYLSQ